MALTSRNALQICGKIFMEIVKKHVGNFSYETIPPYIISIDESDSGSESEDDAEDSKFSSKIIELEQNTKVNEYLLR